jgi:hypothetical protein
MAEETPNQGDKEIELLKYNHQGLHEALWNNHKVAWQVTSIFVPVLFAMLGYLVNGYSDFSKFQVVMGFLVTEGLLFIWLLIMRIFEHYNEKRKEKLGEIENRLNELVPGINFQLADLPFRQIPKKLKFSPTNIYHILFGLYSILNLGFLLAKLTSGW